jgi:hypothetical protein
MVELCEVIAVASCYTSCILLLGPTPAAKTRLLSFNRIQSRVVIGLLTGHNTLRRLLHLMGLANSPLM